MSRMNTRCLAVAAALTMSGYERDMIGLASVSANHDPVAFCKISSC